ncbi:MAG: ABC transporter ATP-binding protein/permease [Bacteroidetes bacterium]|nr:ABC transporter ATP-binding protein/permease [Bacteroidota bacterium]MBU1421657.1 ABC transporter ATP-binding protein/permease [Bacteroidota bacterium]MBU2470785.1 ABC transporter ATP-binding protein/permease [Bacteroidota bacterium]MBU2635641.1 ABC transporter ATP-binding protein/permease [Bacteroidota bacterium]
MKPLLRLLPYLSKYKKTLFMGLLSIVGSNIFTVIQPHFIGKAIDELKRGISTHNLDPVDLLFYAGLIVGFTLVAGVLSFLTRQTIIVVSRHIEYDIRNDFLSHIQKLPFSYFQNTPTGDLMAHATNDIGAVRNTLGPGIMYPADTLVTFVMVLTMMLLKDWQLTLMVLIPLPLVSFAVYKLGKLINQRFQERQEQYSKLTTRAQESLSGIRVIKAYVRENFEIESFRSISWEYFKKNLVLAKIQSIIWPTMFLLVGVSLVITIYYGGSKVIDGKLSIGTLTAFFAYLVMLIWPMIAFGWVINILQQGAASMKRLAKIFDTEPEIENNEYTDYSIKEIKGDIEFRNVTFNHKKSKQPDLQNIQLKIERGKTIAVVGYTGSGKSTIVNLIPRLYDISDGELLIDGIDIKKIPLEVLRSNIGYVPQETFLFSDTIAHNIAYGVEEYDEVNIVQAADIAQLTKDVEEFPKQFETMIGERGITLSGGQKQRAGIARAVIRDPKILILDDALSAVDIHTEEEILKRLKKVMENRTSIIISHRISTVKDADLIVVIDKGQIVERGTHGELVVIGGIYADLHYKQMLEEELEKL